MIYINLIKLRIITDPIEEEWNAFLLCISLLLKCWYIKMNKNNRWFQLIKSATPSDRMRDFN